MTAWGSTPGPVLRGRGQRSQELTLPNQSPLEGRGACRLRKEHKELCHPCCVTSA
jgi:hypothetical protein